MKFIFTLVVGFISYLLFSKKGKELVNEVIGKKENPNIYENETLRGYDLGGGGHFGAPRHGRTHKGLDFLKDVGEAVYVPFDSYLNRIGNVYSNDVRYKLVEIIGTGLYKDFRAKIMYCTTVDNPLSKKEYKQGDFIGVAQDIKAKHPTVQNHIHLEIYDQNGNLVNPETLRNSASV